MNYNDERVDFNEYFTYSPPRTDERKLKHQKIGIASKELAKLVWDYLDEEDTLRNEFLNNIQFIRMMLNQAVTITELIDQKEKEKTS